MKYNQQWDLSQLGYTSIEDPKLLKDFETYERYAQALRMKWNIDAEEVYKRYIEYNDDFQSLNAFTNIWEYLFLYISLDENNIPANKLLQNLEKRNTDIQQALLFTSRIDKEIGYDRLMKLSTELPEYKLSLEQTANDLKHTLNESEEKVLLIQGEPYNSVYDKYAAAMTFEFKGEIISHSELWAKRTSDDRMERELAYRIIANVFSTMPHRVLYENLYSTICKENVAEMKLRGYNDVMESHNDSEDMTNDSVNTILDKVYEYYPLYHQFLRLKAKVMGMDKLEIWDINSYIVSGEVTHVSFDECMDFYMKTIKEVDEEIYNHGMWMNDNKRVDAMPKIGKAGGAYASYHKGLGEYTLLNHDDTLSYVTTIAHELGHCYHGSKSNKQNYTNYYSSLCLAETASIFNETVVFDALLKESTDKVALITNRLSDIFSTIFRQVAYVRFERKCHNSWLNNEPLSWEDYNEFWFQEMNDLYGGTVNMDKNLVESYWMHIPHIYHTPFYCYAYAFGNILSLNVYQNYKESSDKNDYMNKYKSFLELGGSLRPKDAVSSVFGLDINSDQFYDVAFEHIRNLIKSLKHNLEPEVSTM